VYYGETSALEVQQMARSYSINRKIKNKICGADDLEGREFGLSRVGGWHIFRSPLPLRDR
jgi:hypothetical protein